MADSGGWLWMLIVWLTPVFILFALAKYLFHSRKQDSGKKAQAILDEAYARNELSREDYLQKRRTYKLHLLNAPFSFFTHNKQRIMAAVRE